MLRISGPSTPDASSFPFFFRRKKKALGVSPHTHFSIPLRTLEFLHPRQQSFSHTLVCICPHTLFSISLSLSLSLSSLGVAVYRSPIPASSRPFHISIPRDTYTPSLPSITTTSISTEPLGGVLRTTARSAGQLWDFPPPPVPFGHRSISCETCKFQSLAWLIACLGRSTPTKPPGSSSRLVFPGLGIPFARAGSTLTLTWTFAGH
ncbi:hypothetical protein ASPZODRAFT_1229786 [Penicilliopsis zonata CBS 506.65]|uniref:Uncharacterized protein n=1 Tax=Penicilliopsis zonata CBS 506.65 TaxID=1073090 RepID=A0A1L9S7K6_9EURO|nr:hypothetical protein ASPZODRAFT_1229786 [Penicilliopsis zonata CBS 506.65]OJJ43157.1 hypothetical protein ASPZODRAFT_1229786 [Penicilliopsis zonata CBS 506.65]